MGHMNRHRKHGDRPKNGSHHPRGQEKTKVERLKRRRRRVKLARARDRDRAERVEAENGWKPWYTCINKRYYNSKDTVARSMARVEAVFGDKCYGYHCPFCGGWHISTHSYDGANEEFCLEES